MNVFPQLHHHIHCGRFSGWHSVQEEEIEAHIRMVNYLETELVCERAVAAGNRSKQANLALEFRLSVELIIDTTCNLVG